MRTIIKGGQLTAERLRELLSYDPNTGEFTRQVELPKSPVGRIVGNVKSNGYMHICVDGRKYHSHRLAWLHSTGHWPCGDIDHIDGERTNNRIANLRDVSRSTNLENQTKARTNNKSTKLIGAYFNAKGNCYYSRISVKGTDKYLGSFKSAQDAHAAYVCAKRQLHEGNTL